MIQFRQSGVGLSGDHCEGLHGALGSSQRTTDFRFAAPASDLMDLFADFAARVLGQIDTQENKVKNLCSTRDLLLPPLLSG